MSEELLVRLALMRSWARRSGYYAVEELCADCATAILERDARIASMDETMESLALDAKEITE